MTREEAGKLAVIAKAYADGKEIEVYDDEDKEWVSIDDPSFDWSMLNDTESSQSQRIVHSKMPKNALRK